MVFKVKALVLTISSAVKVNVKGVTPPVIEAVPTVNVSPITYPEPPLTIVAEEIVVSESNVTVIVAPVPDKLPVVPYILVRFFQLV